jgi:cytidyltransferase-like protein
MEQRAREMGKKSQAAVYRAYINKMKKKTKKKNEEFGAPAGMLPSPSRKMVKKMKRKGNTSVPYGSGYKKVNEVQKTVTNKSFDKKRESGDWTVIGHMKKRGKSIFHVRDEKTKKRFDVKLMEQKEIKKVIGVFGGRFQPFHSGHLATYKWLSKRVDEVYITTSNIKQPPRHPMNFKEKVRHMTKMGIKKNRIVQEKTPYVAANLLKKFNPDTTAVVYAFGKKDAGRLKGGTKKSGGKTYYQDFLKNKNNLEGFEKHGYYITAPQFGSVSGTQMRKLLGDPKVDDSERVKGFKKVFGYYDKGIYTMMTNKFKKLFESYDLTDELIKEFLVEATATTGGNLDDGPSTFYTDYNTYKRVSKEWLDSLYSEAGWKVVDYVLRDNASSTFKDEYRSVPLTYLDHGQAAGSTSAVTKYKKWMGEVIEPLGWEVVNWMGTTAAINNIIGTLFAAGADSDEYTEEDFKLTERINLDSEVKLLLEGGAYGHLNHPFDDKNLTFSDFKTLIINTLQGKLDSEGAVTEKTDGQNIMVSWKNGKLIAARNKGHIKNHGAGALDIGGVKNMFSGRGDIEKAFVYAMRDLQRAIGGLSDAQKTKIFDEGKKFMSLEVIYPATANVIPYDKSLLQFHGTIEYDSDGSPVGEDRGSARVLAGMIKQINQNIQKAFKIEKPFISKLPQVKDFSKRQSYFLGKLNKLKNRYGLRDSNTLADYHQAYWMEYIFNAGKQFKYNVPNRILVKLTQRWAFLDKSYKIQQIRKDIKNEKFLDWILKTDKMDLKGLQKKHIRDWEVLFFELGAEILSNLSDFIAANPDKAAQQIRKDLVKAVSKVRKSKDPKVLNTLKTQLDRLKAIGGLKSVVPSEGITFVFKGKLYKYTGAFAPANQILGMLKFV